MSDIEKILKLIEGFEGIKAEIREKDKPIILFDEY